MLKADRDRIMGNLQDDERQRFRQFIDGYRTKRRAVTGSQMPAREMLGVLGPDITDKLRQAMAAVVARNEMGPHVG